MWNQNISQAPVDPRLRQIMKGSTAPTCTLTSARRRFTGFPTPLPTHSTKGVKVKYTAYGNESDKGKYKIPLKVADRGRQERRWRPPYARRRYLELQALRALPRLPRQEAQALEGRGRRDLGPQQRRPSTRGLDVGRRCRPADLPGPRPLRGGRRGRDQPRDPHHLRPDARRLHPPGVSLRRRDQQPQCCPRWASASV